MTLKEIKEIIALMNDNNLNEIEIEREGQKLKLKKAADNVMMAGSGHYALESIPAPKIVAPSDSTVAVTNGTPNKPSSGIKSPMVGTFYRSPSPEAGSFVEVGQIVEIGQVVCIVEAMKLMNEIKSEIRGKVVSVEVENAEPVEFGQMLFAVEPA